MLAQRRFLKNNEPTEKEPANASPSQNDSSQYDSLAVPRRSAVLRGVYVVVATDGTIRTVGHRTRRLRRH